MKSQIVTLPIKVYEKDKIGLLVVPTFAEILKYKTGYETILALNISDSFKDRSQYIERYYNLIKDTNIILDNVWMDSKNKDKLLAEVEKLVNLGYIKEKSKNLNYCKCNKVEIDENISGKLKGKCYRKENDKMFCNFCNEEIRTVSKKCLVFEVPENNYNNIIAIPPKAEKQLKEMAKKISGNDIIISRQRETGYKYFFNDTFYNIDVDFIWQNYLSTLNDSETKIIIGSNHTLYAMYMINLVESCKGKQNLSFVVLPHVKGLEDLEFTNLDTKTKKAVLALSARKMKSSDSKWDEGLYNYMEKIPKMKKEKYLKELYSKVEIDKNESVHNYIQRIIFEEMRFQDLILKNKNNGDYER